MKRISIIFRSLGWVGFAFLFIMANNFAQGQWTEPQRLLTFSAVGAQDIWITNDELRLYCKAGGLSVSDIYVSTRMHVDSAWGQFTMLPPQINDPGAQISPCESPDGDTLYFCNWSREAGSSYDVFYSVLTDTGWGPKQNLGEPISTPLFELGMRLSRDGTMMVVSRAGDLFYHERQQDGTWGPSVDFGPNVNTFDEDFHPCLSPDRRELFFYRQGPNSGDVWRSILTGDIWQPAEPMPAPICSLMTKEDSPCMLSDGRTLVFRHQIGSNAHDTQLFYSTDTTRLTARESLHNSIISNWQLTTYPNPFNSTLSISLAIPPHQETTIALYDLLGREVDVIYRGRLTNSTISYRAPAGLASGIYFVRAEAGGRAEMRKVVLLK